MNKVAKDLFKTVVFAALWFISAYFAFEVWFPTDWAYLCGLTNAVLGTVALFFVIRTEEGEKMFFEGPDNGGWIVIGLLWAVPGVIMITGAFWWMIRFLLQFLGYWKL